MHENRVAQTVTRSLSGNSIGPKGALQIAAVLENSKLTTLL
jgi:hypothetical protein